MKEISRLVRMIQTIVVIVIVLSLLVFFPWQAIQGQLGHMQQNGQMHYSVSHTIICYTKCASPHDRPNGGLGPNLLAPHYGVTGTLACGKGRLACGSAHRQLP